VLLLCVPPPHTHTHTHPNSWQGYNGSQLWDTAFAAQALCDAGLGPDDVVDKVGNHELIN
jgi:hypothetical protein